ncbi:MAG: cytochrome c-type biogenesis protein CcmH [Gemmatimonadota bacterium]
MTHTARRLPWMLGLVALVAAGPIAAQSTGPVHAGYDPNAVMGGHVHEGELGEKLMLIETDLKCNCGCGLDVHTCQFSMQCGTSPAWTRRIVESLEAGETPEAIRASFVADYGTQVLMLPPAEGFNILGYILPAIAIVSASMLIGMFIRGRDTTAALTPVTELSDEDAERLRAAMRKLDQDESPDW